MTSATNAYGTLVLSPKQRNGSGTHPCNDCSACCKEIFRKKPKRNKYTYILFIVFCERIEREGIERDQTTQAVASATSKQEDDRKTMFTTTCFDINVTLLVLISAGFVDYAIAYNKKRH